MGKTTFTLSEAADLLSCHTETLRRAIKDGLLRAARLGREYRISRSDLQVFWTERGGGELFPGQNAVQKSATMPPETLSQKQSGIPVVLATAPTLQTNGPKQLSLLTPGGIQHE